MNIKIQEYSEKLDEMIDIDLDVDYDVFGSHYAATMTSPEEFPEIEIISAIDKNGNEFELDSEQQQQVINQIYTKLGY